MADRDLVRKDRQSSPASSPRGTNYLLAIAINDYLHCSKLNNAVRDAEAFIELLTTRYHFDLAHVTFIKDADATEKHIRRAFDRLIDVVTEQDNLIVYFSGHGRHHERRGGYWIPVEAGTGDDWVDYIPNSHIKDYLSKIKSFHTFLIADSCFSGSLFIDKSKEKFSGDRRDTEPSRWGLTSGKKEIVSDGQPGQHSPFAAALLDVLRKADQPPGVMRICDLVLEKVAANAQQTPMGSPLQVSGHQGGQLVFYFREDEEREWLELGSSAEGCRTYLTRFPEGKYRSLAEEIVAKDREAKAWQQAKAAGVKYALLDFERDFPNSTPVLSGELNRLLASMEEEELWLEATQSNTVSAYRMYLMRSVLKKHVIEATEAIKAISEKERETLAWERANQLNTITAFEAYLRDYPQGIYAVDADRVLKQLRGKVVKDQPVGPSKGENVIEEQVLYTPADTKDQPNVKEPSPNSKLRLVVLSIIGFVLVLIVGNWTRGLFVEVGKKQTDRNITEGVIPTSSNSSMVLIPGGKFLMGSSNGEADEKPVHEVSINSFYLSKYEVTLMEFSKFIEETSYQTDAEKDGGSYFWNGKEWEKKSGINWKYDAEAKLRPSSDYTHPVIHVSWNDATAYCKWLSQKTGQNYRLPTEAEWEYAAGNGRKHTKYSWGNTNPSGKQGGNVGDENGAAKFDLTEDAKRIFVDYSDGFSATAPVGSFNANAYGLFDMSGNVWEWCQDWYDSDYYAKSPSINPKGSDIGAHCVFRGGSWLDIPADIRVASRFSLTPDNRYGNIGFRLARQELTPNSYNLFNIMKLIFLTSVIMVVMYLSFSRLRHKKRLRYRF